ncbi:hypothetical protein BREVNS_1401 [Brevinematales bacterium NS]|nr:hypothetical protein BREVNS_1401 [Brevinematales bacterium NS]
MFNHLFSFSFRLFLLPIFLFSMKRSRAGQKGRCPRRMLRMRLGRKMGRFCGQIERPHLFPGKSFLRGRHCLALWTSATTTRPPDFGSITPTSLCRFPAKAGSPRLHFGGLLRKSNKRCRPGCLLHPHSGRTSTLQQRAHDRKSGPVGYRKKGVIKEPGILSPARRASLPAGLFRYSIAVEAKAMTLFQQRAMV